MKSITSLIAGAVLLGAAGFAGADEPILLSPAQMDVVSAGYNSWGGQSTGDASFTANAYGDTLPYVYSYTGQDVYQTCYSGSCSSGNFVYANTSPN